MTRLVLTFAVGAVVGVGVGAPLARQAAERPVLVHCSAAGVSSREIKPCPPPIGVPVIATWGDLTARATWTGRRWQFDRTVLGQKRTSQPADAWHELPEATR